MYYGYCYPSNDGFYTPKVSLVNPQEVFHYVMLHKGMMHEIRITDDDDFTVVNAIDGQIIFPEEWKVYNKEAAK